MRAQNPSHALAQVLADELVRCGLRHAVLAPGSRSAALAMALHEHPRIRLHVEIDERSAAFLALGIGRGGGQPAAVLSTSGTASANFHPAVVEADRSRVPLLVLTADRPPELRDTAANQTIDQLRLYGGAVRWFCEVGVPEARPEAPRYWRSVAARAWATAVGGPSGPVHLNLAFREPLVPVPEDGSAFPHDLDGRPGGAPWTAVTRPSAQPDAAGCDRLARQVAATRRGVLVVGDTPHRPAVDGLADHLAWPILAEPQSGCRSGPDAVSTYDLLLRHASFASAHAPDFALVIGRVALSRRLLSWLDGAEQVLVDPDGAWLDPSRALSRIVAAEPSAVAAEVVRRAERRERRDWLDAWRRAERVARVAVDAAMDACDEPTEPRIARDLAALLPDGSALVAASSMPVRDLATFMRPRAGLRVLGNRGASGIDGFVSAALGVALVHDGPVVALAGDLSLLHDQNGLLLAGRDDIDLTFVVVNNDGGGIFSFLPQAAFPESFEDVFGTPHGVDLDRLAALHGCGYRHLEQASQLADLLDQARSEGGVQLIEARTDRADNVEVHAVLERVAVEALER